jgi:hypothetical protein
MPVAAFCGNASAARANNAVGASGEKWPHVLDLFSGHAMF